MELPKGMRDFPPAEKLLRDETIRAVTRVFQRYGYNPIETPIIERWDVLNAKEETDVMQEVYRLQDRGGRELGLRYDLTVPAARFVASHPELKMPFKRYQTGTVYRDGPIKAGRYREFTQCDFDIFGAKSIKADAEIIQVFHDAFKALDLDATIHVNNRKLLAALIETAGIEEDAESVMITLDKHDKIGADGVRKELKEKGIDDDAITKLEGYLATEGTNEERLAALEEILPEEKREGLEELKELLQYAEARFSPGLARGLAYYTGTVYEGTIEGISSSICGGGRYDNLIQGLGGRQVPAVGGSLGIEPITEYLKERAKGKQGVKKTVATAYVIPIKCYDKALPIARRLRDAGINTEVDVMDRSLGKNLEYANAQDIPYAIIIGAQELKDGKAKLKDMRTGDERLATVEEIEKTLR